MIEEYQGVKVSRVDVGLRVAATALHSGPIRSPDAVDGYFEAGRRPKRVRLHFSQDPVLAVA